jgi:hypothetical protein
MGDAASLKALSGTLKGFKAINAVNALKAAAIWWLRQPSLQSGEI